MQESIKKTILILLGGFFIASSVHFFMGPEAFAAGGLGGLAIILHFVHPAWQIGTILLIGNILLFALGLLVLGKQFGLLTLFGATAYSVWIMVFERMIPMVEPMISDKVITLLIGSALSGLGLSIVFAQNASTGGTDIIAKMLNHFFKINLSLALFLVDGMVVILSAIFISLDRALFAVVGIYIQSVLMNQLISGFARRIVMNITTDRVEEVNHFIHQHMNRGTTIYPAYGGYSNREKQIIVTVVHQREYIIIKEFIEKVDPRAFVFVYSASEVVGEGFTYK